MNFNDSATRKKKTRERERDERERERERERRQRSVAIPASNRAVISPDALPRFVSIASGTTCTRVLPLILSWAFKNQREILSGREWRRRGASRQVPSRQLTIPAIPPLSVSYFAEESSQSPFPPSPSSPSNRKDTSAGCDTSVHKSTHILACNRARGHVTTGPDHLEDRRRGFSMYLLNNTFAQPRLLYPWLYKEIRAGGSIRRMIEREIRQSHFSISFFSRGTTIKLRFQESSWHLAHLDIFTAVSQLMSQDLLEDRSIQHTFYSKNIFRIFSGYL